jgi:hypothetical protein
MLLLQGLDLSLLGVINAKLGPQVAGGLSTRLNNLMKWLHLDRALNILIWWQTLHNAYMLSNNLGQTLTSAISNVLAVVGIKDADDNPLDIGKILGKQFDEMAKTALGEKTWGSMKAEWKKYNRIYQAAANLLNSIQSIGQSILSALEIIGSWNAKIGNALRFKNQDDDDISTPKKALKHACKIKDADTATMTMMRMWLFEITVGHAQALQAPIYGIPVQELQSNAKFKPQVKLYFFEPWNQETENSGLPLATGEIGFRLIHETSETITRTYAESLARKIKADFAKPIFTWEKGWYKCTYLDTDRRYDLRLLVKSKAEGVRVVKQVIGIQNHPYDKDFIQFVEHYRSYPLNPGTHRVYGKLIKKPIKRQLC